MDKELLGVVAIILGIIGYYKYFMAIYRGETKPHVFSWVIWATLTAIAFAAQVADEGGPGAWVTGFTAIICGVVVICAIFRGERTITRSDWVTFLAALSAIPLWLITKNPLWSVILITIIDALGFYPTFRKSWLKPMEENAAAYALSSIKFLISLFALTSFTLTTALYPASLVLMNGLFVVMVLWRKRVLAAR